MLEKKLVEILEPLADEIVDLQKQVNEIKAIPGEPGKDGKDGNDGLGINTKQWEPGVYREGVYVTHAIGKIYKALRDTAEKPGHEDWERVGDAGFDWKGLKQEGAAYENGDLYIDNGSTFIWWNGKGSMFTQRGKNGKDGERGEKGDAGQDAPTIVAIKYTGSGMDMALSNGEVLSADVDGFHETIKELSQGAVLYWMDAVFAQIEEEGGTPVRSFKGAFVLHQSYSVGDIVTFNKAAWVCRKATDGKIFDEDTWRRMFSMGGGGGGGATPLADWPTPVLSNLNMGGFSIDNVAVGSTPGSLVNKGYVDAKSPSIFTLANTDTLLAVTGGTVADKLTQTAGVPKNGTLVFVGFSTATGANNANAGLWRYDGAHWNRVILGSAGGAATATGAATVKTTTATVLSGSGADPIIALKTGFNAIFGAAPANGEIVLVSGGSGATAAFNGTYIFDGTKWHLMSSDLSGFINGAAKNKASDADPVIKSFPTGSIITTLEKDKKEIRVKDSAGNLVSVYSETDIMGKIAASRTFKGTAIEAGATRTGSVATNVMKAEDALTAEDLGSYWVYVGTAGHTIAANDMGGKKSAIDGLQFQSGDWIMVANVGSTATPKYQYVLIHGDNIGRAQADGLFGHNVWTAGSYEAGTIVRYQTSGADPIRYYKASSPIISTDPAPGAVIPSTAPAGYGAAWQIVVDDPPAVGTHIGVRVTIEGIPPVVIDYVSGAGDVGESPTAESLRTALLADPLIAASITIQHVPAGSGNLLLMSKTVSFLVDAGVHATPNLVMAPLPGKNKWVDITPVPLLKDLLDVDLDTTAPAGGDSLLYNATTGVWEPKAIRQPVVYCGDADFDSTHVDAAHNYGMSTNTRPDPALLHPVAGDIYINTISGAITEITATGGVDTGMQLGSQAADLDSLSDVDAKNPGVGDVLTWDGVEWAPSHDLEDKLASIVSGIEHGAAVSYITNTPPVHPEDGMLVIVGTTPTGVFGGHKNAVAFFNNGAWEFAPPRANEAHLNENDDSTYHWNGTAWNKIANAGGSGAGDVKILTPTIAANGGVQANGIIDLGRKDWKRVEIKGTVENRTGNTGLGLRFYAAPAGGNRISSFNKDQITQLYASIVWHSNVSSYSNVRPNITSNWFMESDVAPLSWYPNSTSNNYLGYQYNPYGQLEINLQRMYDKYIAVAVKHFYFAVEGYGFEVNLNYTLDLNPAHDEINQLQFIHNAASRFVFNGRVSVF